MFRADSHHTKPEVMSWLRANAVQWISGLSPNKRLNEEFADVCERAVRDYQEREKEGNRTSAQQARTAFLDPIRAVSPARNPGR